MSTTYELTARQIKAIANVKVEVEHDIAEQNRRIASMDNLENHKGYEVKRWAVTEPGEGDYPSPIAFIIVETGMINDEGTLAALYCRTSRHIAVRAGGGLQLLNAENKRNSRGLWNVCHRVAKS